MFDCKCLFADGADIPVTIALRKGRLKTFGTIRHVCFQMTPRAPDEVLRILPACKESLERPSNLYWASFCKSRPILLFSVCSI